MMWKMLEQVPRSRLGKLVQVVSILITWMMTVTIVMIMMILLAIDNEKCFSLSRLAVISTYFHFVIPTVSLTTSTSLIGSPGGVGDHYN